MKFDINNLVRENIKQMKAYSSARDEYASPSENQIFIDANENPFNTGLNRYPDPHQKALKFEIAKQKNLEENQILLGNGSDEVLDLIFRAFIEPIKDEIIVNPPTYGMYEVLANLNNVNVKKVDLTAQFDLDVEAINGAISNKTKAIFICSPNNPTGNCVSSQAILKLLEQDLLVIVDEAYIDFTNQNSWTGLIEQFPNLIVTQTLSKAYGLAGIRLGMCFAQSAIIDVLRKIKMPYNVNALTQLKALECVVQQDKMKREVQELINQREWLKNGLQELKLVEKIYPSDANFLLVKVNDANAIYDSLLENNIIVRNRSKEAGCNNCLRITVGSAEENLRLIDVLKNINNE